MYDDSYESRSVTNLLPKKYEFPGKEKKPAEWLVKNLDPVANLKTKISKVTSHSFSSCLKASHVRFFQDLMFSVINNCCIRKAFLKERCFETVGVISVDKCKEWMLMWT